MLAGHSKAKAYWSLFSDLLHGKNAKIVKDISEVIGLTYEDFHFEYAPETGNIIIMLNDEEDFNCFYIVPYMSYTFFGYFLTYAIQPSHKSSIHEKTILLTPEIISNLEQSYKKEDTLWIEYNKITAAKNVEINKLADERKNPQAITINEVEPSVDELLDLMNLAQSLNDEKWINEIKEQLNNSRK